MWTLDLIRELADESGEVLASIYFPTHSAGPEIQQDPIRLKNAVQALTADADEQGLDGDAFASMIAHPAALIDDREFWRHQSNGLALFCRPSGMTLLKLPFTPTEFNRLGERFHLAPLVLAAGDVQVFHMLAVNREGSVLYDIAGTDVAERPIDPMLDSLSAARGMSEFDASTGFHTDHRGGEKGGGPDGTPRYHALGTGADEQEEVELERYLASIASAVGEALAASEAPLVLAGGDRIVGRIRGMIRTRTLCDGYVDRNTKSATAEELADAAREIVEAETESPRDDAFERLEARLASGEATASKDSETLVKAASEGRVDVAFLDLQDNAVGSETDRQRARLVDAIAVDTLRHGGTVYAMPSHAEIKPAAALLR